MKKRFIITAIMLSISVTAIHSQITKSEIRGTVIREWDGNAIIPIENASIYLQRALPTGGILPYFVFIDSIKTDSKGKYSFDSITTDSYLLTFTARGYRTEQVFLSVRRDTVINTDLMLVTKFYNLGGKVTLDCPTCESAFPAPLPGCTVSVFFPHYYAISYQQDMAPFLPFFQWPYRAITGSDGTYLIDSIPADTSLSDSVYVSAVKFGYQQKNVYKKLHVTKTDTLDFSLPRNQTGIWQPAIKTATNEQRISFSAATSTLQLTINRAQSVSVDVFSPDGKLIGNVIQKKHFDAGQHSIILRKEILRSRIVMIRAVGDNLNNVIKVIVK